MTYSIAETVPSILHTSEQFQIGNAFQIIQLSISLFFPLKVHVNLLLIEARMQAELLYALRAITRYMT